jgi:Zn-dependent protease
MFGSPSFQFRLFGIQVNVDLFFLVLAVLIGGRGIRGSLVMLVSWVAIVFASVLLHEMGHALSARLFGQQPFIALHGLGGVTVWRQAGELSAGRRLLISLAGPSVGIVVGTAALVVQALLPNGTVADRVASFVVFANLGWGILNLVPMLPLDGGKIMESLFDLLAPGRGARAARYASIVTALLLAPLSWAVGMYMMVLYCGLAIWSNVSELRRRPAPPASPSQAVIDVAAEPVSNEVNPGRDDRAN